MLKEKSFKDGCLLSTELQCSNLNTVKLLILLAELLATPSNYSYETTIVYQIFHILMHRRTPSVVRVRTVSESHQASLLDESALLSPSSAELPSALPSSASPASASGLGPSASTTKSSEKYGFVVYVGSLVGWYVYLVWAFTPDKYLRWLGLEWYPNR